MKLHRHYRPRTPGLSTTPPADRRDIPRRGGAPFSRQPGLLCGPGCEAVPRPLWRNTVQPGKGVRLTVRYDEAHDDPQGAGRNLGGGLDEILGQHSAPLSLVPLIQHLSNPQFEQTVQTLLEELPESERN
jgi:hypothetical protein